MTTHEQAAPRGIRFVRCTYGRLPMRVYVDVVDVLDAYLSLRAERRRRERGE